MKTKTHPDASETHPNPPPGVRTCVGCGCTDDDACLDPETGEPCFWLEGFAGDCQDPASTAVAYICSVCGRRMLELSESGALTMPDQDEDAFQAAMRAALEWGEQFERGYAKPDPNAPLVEVFSEHQADLAIRERRKAARA